MGKSSLILVLGAISLFAIVNMNVNNRLVEASSSSYTFYNQTYVRNIANSMVNILLYEIGKDTDYRVESETTIDLFGGSADYTVTDGIGDDSLLIRIDVSAYYSGVTKDIIVYASVGGGWVPPFVRAAWTANGDLNQTISDMYIDGRDHDLDLNIIPISGRPGISSSVEFRNVDNAAIGGTGNNGVDYPMTFPEDPNAIEEFYDWGGTFPSTPDEILGYPEGTLKSIAQSGESGSQYILNPGKKITNADAGLNNPVSGVTYIEITDGIESELKFGGAGNSGIVVVHAPDGSARLKGVKFDGGGKTKKGAPPPAPSDGVFTGLLVTDYSFHHHLDILGAVLQLSPNLETDKTCNGNLDHWAYYSSEAIINATQITSELSGLRGNNTDSEGFGSGRVRVVRWYE